MATLEELKQLYQAAVSSARWSRERLQPAQEKLDALAAELIRQEQIVAELQTEVDYADQGMQDAGQAVAEYHVAPGDTVAWVDLSPWVLSRPGHHKARRAEIAIGEVTTLGWDDPLTPSVDVALADGSILTLPFGSYHIISRRLREGEGLE